MMMLINYTSKIKTIQNLTELVYKLKTNLIN